MNGRRNDTPQRKPDGNGNGNGHGNRRYRVSTPVEREGRETYWARLGLAFENPAKDGKPASITVYLDALPRGEKLILFEDDGKGSEG